jgi:arabinofuranan 3-O-arabinosyltransferase
MLEAMASHRSCTLGDLDRLLAPRGVAFANLVEMAFILVGVGPLAWMVYAVAVEREATVRQALAAAVRIGALTLATSLWWIAGLFIQGTHGLPVIRYTETFRTVSEASTAPEVLRGLGYWFFYGSDKLGPWIEPSVTFTTNLPALALSFALPLAGLAALVVVRWRHRGIFAVMAALGGLIAVGGHPWEEGSWLGQWFTTFTRRQARSGPNRCSGVGQMSAGGGASKAAA